MKKKKEKVIFDFGQGQFIVPVSFIDGQEDDEVRERLNIAQSAIDERFQMSEERLNDRRKRRRERRRRLKRK